MYNLIRGFFVLLMTVVFRWRVTGRENIPSTGPVIVAANHISNFDPFVVGAALQRPVHFMAKEELFANPVLSAIIKYLGTFPVRRGASDRNAIRIAINLLEEGRVVGLFPEGTRSKTGELSQAEPGLAMIAAKAGATIIPAAIIGTNRVFWDGQRLARFEIHFGNPIIVPKGKASKEELDRITALMMQEISGLLQRYTY